MKTPILGSSYVASSVNAADSRMVNLYPEIVPEAGKEPAFLKRCPGLSLLATVGSGPIRGEHRLGSFLYIVSGDSFYKVDTSWNSTLIGVVFGSSGSVSMADNGTQIFIACQGPSFIYNSTTLAFGQITDPDFPGAVTVDYIDGYFVFNEPFGQKVWVTQLLDGTSIDPLDFASAEGSPDGLVALIVDHQQIVLFGTESVEFWYDAGIPAFPLQRIQGAFNEVGCLAAFSIAKLDNTVMFLGSDPRGQGVVYRNVGYSAQRISTHAVEWQIQRYSNLSDAVGYSYQQEGHSFYVLVFPTANTTWVYDATTEAWHERAGFSNGSFVRHRGNCQASFNNKIVIGDFENGNIYSFEPTVYADNLQPQKWLRSWRALPTGANNLKRTIHSSLQLDCQTGVGLSTGQGSDPQVMLRWSDDGGHIWSSEHWRSMGKIGEYWYRTIWRRLGMTISARDRVYEVSGTDPVSIAIMGARLEITATNA